MIYAGMNDNSVVKRLFERIPKGSRAKLRSRAKYAVFYWVRLALTVNEEYASTTNYTTCLERPINYSRDDNSMVK